MGLKRRNKISASFSMSSMTDIVFLLLIFFMITSTMVHPNAIKLVVPRKSTSKVMVDKFLNVRINASGTYFLNGKTTTIETLGNRIQNELRKQDNVFLKLTTDGSAQTGVVARVLDLAETNGIKVVLDIK